MLAPIGGIRFCLEHRPDCAASSARPDNEGVALTNERWQELWRIDHEVNQEISPDAKLGPGTEQWKIAPLYGNCHDYAVTKRHDLLALGWPPSDLLLAEVLLPTDEHHLVLVVRTSEGDLVLDNLNSDLVPVAATYGRFKWLRIQTPQNPYYWARVGTSGTERSGPRHLSLAVAIEPAITPNEAPQAYAPQWAPGVQPGSPALRQSIAEQKQTARAQRPVPPFGRAEASSAFHRQAVGRGCKLQERGPGVPWPARLPEASRSAILCGCHAATIGRCRTIAKDVENLAWRQQQYRDLVTLVIPTCSAKPCHAAASLVIPTAAAESCRCPECRRPVHCWQAPGQKCDVDRVWRT